MKGFEEPTRAKINGIIKAQNSQIAIYSMDDIGLSPEEVGIKGSPTYVSRAFRPEKTRGECQICSDCNTLLEKINGGLADE